MKKALMLASVASMIDQFNMPNIEILRSLGYKVDVVADFTNPGTITIQRAEDIRAKLKNKDVQVFDVPIPRSINPRAVKTSCKKVKSLIDKEEYSLIHCHSPIGGVICRLAAKKARKNGTKVIYTAHGFHFYTGAPLKNWMIFYPIEKWMSRYTDVLITINQEDYKRASDHFRAWKTVYVPGIGVDTEKFKLRENGRERIRAELGLNEDQIVLLSVGELNENKNHETVIKAISGMDLVYVIVGKGELEEKLRLTAKDCNVVLHLMGFRTDVADFYDAADVYVLPSIREGLNVSLMEAMASGLACVVSDIRGNRDLIDEKGGYTFNAKSYYDLKQVINTINMMGHNDAKIKGIYNLGKIVGFGTNKIHQDMYEIYKAV